MSLLHSPFVLARVRDGADAPARWWVVGGVLAAVGAVPLLVSGPGNDLDVANNFRSGRSIARHLSYVPSRSPGAPVHETIVGVLDLLGGPLLTNLASLVAAVVLLVSLDRLLRREGVRAGGRWAVALVAANPWFVIAATSTADYLFALAFVVLAAHAVRSRRPVLAGLLAAAAMGCRIGSAALIVALLLAELADDGDPARTEPDRVGDETSRQASRDRSATVRSLATTVAVAGVATVALFIPAFFAAGGISFAENDFSTSSPLVQLGRAAVKDVTLLGPIASVVALLTVPALLSLLKRWRTTWLVRFAVVGFVLSQIIFIRFPWKMPHLLPCLLCGAILLGAALDARPKLLVALVVLQLVFCVVGVELIRPDDPNAAKSGQLHPHVGWGPVVVDFQCRREHRNAYRGRQKVEVEAAWNCARPFGGGSG